MPEPRAPAAGAGLARVPKAHRRPLQLITTVLLLATMPAPAQDRVPSGAVESAIYKGVNWIKAQRPAGQVHWETGDSSERYWGGDTGLALLALLAAGEDPHREDIARALDWLAAQPLQATYTYSVRAQVLSMAPGTKYADRLEKDCEWLVRAAYPRGSSNFGAYGYLSAQQEGPNGWYDHSNSQFGVLGVWLAAEAGAKVPEPENFWLLIEDRWMINQNPDGGWGYKRAENSTGSMTAAGLATMYIVLDHAHAKTGHRKAMRLIRGIEAAMVWLGVNFTPDNPKGDGQYKYYYLYGMERAARAGGRKYFRGHDWFREGALALLREQDSEGAWAGGLRNTAFAVLFLCYGRAPLIFNKLDYQGDWDVYLRDAAGLKRFAERALERTYNWQVVDLQGPAEDLFEAPVLYLTGRESVAFDDVAVFKLREYCRRGGMIFAVAAEGGDAFAESMHKLARQLFPELKLRPVTREHPLFNGAVQYAIDKPPLTLHAHNGVRSLMVVCLDDVARAWNEYRVEQQPRDFQVGVNVYLYATDKSNLSSRLDTPEIPIEPADIRRTLRVARIQYNGPWDVEPYGWTRVRAYMNNACATRVLVTSGVTFDSLDFKDFKIAYISGTEAFELNAREQAGLRSFLTSGGTLLADGACSSRAFVESLEKQLSEALKVEPKLIEPDSFLISGEGIPDAQRLTGLSYRRSTRVEPGRDAPLLKGYDLGRRLAVIYSPMDLSAALLGTPVYDCRGHAPESALRVLRNLLLYAGLSTTEKAALSEAETKARRNESR